jgi:hypothetical protein
MKQETLEEVALRIYQGDLIEVCNYLEGEWNTRKVVGFQSNGNVVTEKENGVICSWKNYRIPTPKKKWKVVRGNDTGNPYLMPYEQGTTLPIITTFED